MGLLYIQQQQERNLSWSHDQRHLQTTEIIMSDVGLVLHI